MQLTAALAAEEPEQRPTPDWDDDLPRPILTDRERLHNAVLRELDGDGWEAAA